MIDTNKVRSLLNNGIANISRSDILALCDEIDRLRGEKQPPQGKTVRAEIKVAVDYNGNIAVGEDNFQWILRPRAYYTLTADLPVPEEVEVEAQVEKEE